MVIEMSRYGSALSTRNLGRVVFSDLRSAIASSCDRVVLDFNGISTVTNSFADEVFGRLVEIMGLQELQRRTTFRGIDRVSALSIRLAIDSCAHKETVSF